MPKIEDYALLGDLHTAALVSSAGSVDWLCLPRFDAPAAFAALLHNEEAGHWALAPAGAGHGAARRYAGNTLVLETDWITSDGAVRVIDFMPPRVGTPHLIRIVVGLAGDVAMRSELRLRFDYGRVVPWLRHHDGRVDAIAGPDRVRLESAVPVSCHAGDTFADFTVRAGDRVPLVMSWAPGHEPEIPQVDPELALSATMEFWTEWSGHAAYRPGPYGDAVNRSIITLKALTYEPTGGIVAAATTSLPEELGGVRNWDYRYCWLRDATYTLQALLAAGFRREAGAWREWLLRAIAGQPETLQILYSLDGARRLPEAELPWLDGYQGSSPVRTGNASAGQLQLDVWGETLDALFLARQAGLPADPDAWALQVALMNTSNRPGPNRTTDCGRCVAAGSTSPTPRSWRGPPPTGWPDRCAPTACPARRCGGSSSAIRSITTS
jgi:GH15 family glucan-1,4-alpha-glucosidase